MTIKKLSLIAAVVLLCTTSAAAGVDGEYGDVYIPIVGNGFVADELDGVPALYNAGDSYYQCSEYVQRYYRCVYGVEMDFSSAGPSCKTEGYWFETVTSELQRGDAAYIPAYNRGKSYGHWAIVKDYSDGVVTLIEQNWRWGNMAAYERKISPTSSGYIFYRLTDGENSSFPSPWAAEAVSRCVELGIPVDDSLRRWVTRLEFCSMLMGVLAVVDPETATGTELFFFDDTASPDVSNAVALGIVSPNGQFHPDDAITRQEAAVMMNGALTALGLGGNEGPSPESGDSTVAQWAEEAVGNMLALYFFVNGDEGDFMPQGRIEVQHACVLMMYLYDYAAKCAPAQPVTAGEIAAVCWDFYGWEEFFKNKG